MVSQQDTPAHKRLRLHCIRNLQNFPHCFLAETWRTKPASPQTLRMSRQKQVLQLLHQNFAPPNPAHTSAFLYQGNFLQPIHRLNMQESEQAHLQTVQLFPYALSASIFMPSFAMSAAQAQPSHPPTPA